jgi:PAS domain S-box-containing protein
MDNKDSPFLKTPSRPLRYFLWFFILAVVLPGTLVGLALTWRSAQQLIEGQQQQARHVASAVAESMGNHVQTMYTGIAVLSQLPLGKDHFPDFYRVAKGLYASQGYHVMLADSDGNQFLSTRLPLGATLPRRDAMDSVRNAIASGRPHASEVFLSKMAGNYVISVDAPVSTRDGMRVITASADATAIAKVLLRATLPEGWLIGLIDQRGVFIARSKDPDQWIGKSTRPELIDASRRSGSGILFNKSVEGFAILNVFNRVPGTDWTVLIGIPETTLYAPVSGRIGIFAALIVIATLLTALLAFLFYRQVNRAAHQLLTIVHDPLRSDDGTEAPVSISEFHAIARALKTAAIEQQQLIEALKQGEERYRTLFESIDEGFCIIELIYDERQEPVDWRFLEVNPSFEKQNGLHEVTGKRIRELAPDLEPHWFAIYGKVARTGEPVRFQNEAKALGARWFDLYAFRVGGPGSHKVAVIFTDITERRRALELLRENQLRYQSVLSALSEGVVSQGRDGAIAAWNPAVERILGLSGDQLRGLKDFDSSWQAIHEDGTPFPLETHPGSVVLRTGTSQSNVIMGIKKPDGSQTWVSISAVPIFKPGDPLPAVAVVSFSDITDRKKTEATLALERSKLAAAFETSAVGFILCDAQGGDISMNATAKELFGYASAEELPRTVDGHVNEWELHYGDGRLIPYDEWPLLRAIRGDFVRDLELHFHNTRTGNKWICRLTVGPVRNSAGEVKFIVQTLFDISETKRLEKALQERNAELERATAAAEKASRAKSEFLSHMSHDLRSPLNAILGFAQLMETGSPPPTPSQKRSLDHILKGGWYLLDLISEILDLAAIESGKLSLPLEPVSLTAVMLDCHNLVESEAQKRGIQLSFLPFDKTWFVNAEQTRVKQVMVNLLSNAIKYNRPQGRVEVKCTAQGPGRIRIAIKDTGMGLRPELKSQLFQPFNRLGQEGGPEEGTGLGLALSKRLVELMGGTIGVESTVGGGSEFWFELIRAVTPQPAAGNTALTKIEPQVMGTAAPRTLLYVEDNPANLALVEQIIADYPHLRLMSVPNGELGVELARTFLPDIILMDVSLPGISGIDAMRILRQKPETARIPVIGVSANAMTRDIEHGLEAGFFRYLTKPFKISELKKALDDALIFSDTGQVNSNKRHESHKL